MGEPMDSLPRDLRLQRQAERRPSLPEQARAVGTPEQIIESLQAELARVSGELERATKAASELDKAALEERAAREKAEAEVRHQNGWAHENLRRAEQAESRLEQVREAFHDCGKDFIRRDGPKAVLVPRDFNEAVAALDAVEAALLERGGE